jgi:hypothetical protein
MKRDKEKHLQMLREALGDSEDMPESPNKIVNGTKK